MDNDVTSAINQVKTIIEEFERICEVCYNLEIEQLPKHLTGQLLRLENLSNSLKYHFDRGFCAKEIQEAVCKMNWKVLCDYDVEGSTEEEEHAISYAIINLSGIARADERHPTEAPSEPKSLDELLSFVPAEHLGAAKQAFERLLQDETIKRVENKFEWLKTPKIVLIGYFAYKGNVDWKMNDGRGYSWKPFADLFGVKASSLKDWYNQSKVGNGTRRINKNCKYIDNIFNQAKEKFP